MTSVANVRFRPFADVRERVQFAVMRYSICLTALLIASCDLTGEVSREERAWANSPDRRTHAILIETNGGATTAFGYFVELHPSDHQGQKPIRVADLYRVNSACEYGLSMYWSDANTLMLGIASADQMHITPSANIGGKQVKVIVGKESGGPADPCRGMAGRPRTT